MKMITCLFVSLAILPAPAQTYSTAAAQTLFTATTQPHSAATTQTGATALQVGIRAEQAENHAIHSGATTIQTGNHAAQTDSFSLERVCDTLSILRLGDSGWPLPFPVYRFETADVNGDGSTDAIVGVIKSTRYDPEVRRRVFIFKNYRGHVRPLWLGSRLGQPVVDFRFIARDGVLRVLETERSGLFLVAEYRWRAFGMEFVRYLGREMDEKKGRLLLAGGDT